MLLREKQPLTETVSRRQHPRDPLALGLADRPRRTHVASIEDRLQRLEGSSRTSMANSGQSGSPVAEAAVDSGLDATSSVPRSGRRRTYDQAFAGSNVGVEHQPVVSTPNNTRSNRGPDVQSQVDGLATVSVNNDDVALYGDSSTIAFARQVASGGESHRPSDRNMSSSIYITPPSGTPDNMSALEPLPPRELDAENFVLPFRRNADNFLDCFWKFVHPLFPVLHRPSFTARYESLWESQSAVGGSDQNVTFIPTLNVVFALGCQFSDLVAAEKKAKTAAAFYGRSRSLLHYDLLGSMQVTVVQWLLLTAVYLQSTSMATTCWTSVGLAIRLAQNLGLHLEPSVVECQVDREMRRRVWHTCVVLDR
jgi:hypothetical protein